MVVGGERLFFLSCFFYLLLACSLCSPPSSSSSRTPPQQKRPRCLELGVGSGYVIASAARLIANRHRFHPSGGLRPEFADDDDDPASSPPSASSSASSRIKKQAALFAVDVSPSAARDASATLRAHSQRKGEGEGKEESTTPIAAVDVALADLARPLLPRLAGAVDLLLFNPPYVPTPREEVYRPGRTEAHSSSSAAAAAGGDMIAAAWAGGDRGREVVDRALPLIARFLRKGGGGGKGKDEDDEGEESGGVALVVALADNDVPDLLRLASTHGLSGEVVAERSADEERLFVLRLVLKS